MKIASFALAVEAAPNRCELSQGSVGDEIMTNDDNPDVCDE